MTRKSLAIAAVLIPALIATSCSTGPTTKEMRTPKGDLLGYLTTAETSPDLCGWASSSIIHDPDFKLRDHQLVALPGTLCTTIAASALVGSAGVLGKSFPKNVGDNITNSNDQSQEAEAYSASSAKATVPPPAATEPKHYVPTYKRH